MAEDKPKAKDQKYDEFVQSMLKSADEKDETEIKDPLGDVDKDTVEDLVEQLKKKRTLRE